MITAPDAQLPFPVHVCYIFTAKLIHPSPFYFVLSQSISSQSSQSSKDGDCQQPQILQRDFDAEELSPETQPVNSRIFKSKSLDSERGPEKQALSASGKFGCYVLLRCGQFVIIGQCSTFHVCMIVKVKAIDWVRWHTQVGA